MNEPPANKTQFDILHTFANMPMASCQKVAKVFKLKYADVVAVKSAPNYETWLLSRKSDTSVGDLFNDLFGSSGKL